MIEQNETLVDRLRILKEKSGMTSAQIADKARVPESTVTRIFTGKTPNPTIITVIAMTKAMGGTAADIFDDDTQVNPQTGVVISDAEKYHKEIIGVYKEMLKVRMRTIKILALAFGTVVSLLIFLLLLDLFNGNFGYFQR